MIKTKTLNVSISAVLEIDYNDADLEKHGVDFRTFKTQVEKTIRSGLLPVFRDDKDTRITLQTVGFPSSKRLKMVRQATTKI